MMAAATARHCHGTQVQVWEGKGPTVLDALLAVIDALAQGEEMNPGILGTYVWDDPEWEPGSDRFVIVTVEV